MRLLWAAVPMSGCVLMMVVVTPMIGGGARHAADLAEPHVADERRQDLEAEPAELRTRLADVEPRPS